MSVLIMDIEVETSQNRIRLCNTRDSSQRMELSLVVCQGGAVIVITDPANMFIVDMLVQSIGAFIDD